MLGDALMRARAVQACDLDVRNAARSIARCAGRCGARSRLLFDDLALDPAFQALRVDRRARAADRAGRVRLRVRLTTSGDYSSCYFSVWAESVARADGGDARASSSSRARTRMRDADASRSTGSSATPAASCATRCFQELADPQLLDEAYPVARNARGGVHLDVPRRAGVCADPARAAGHGKDAPGARHPRGDLAPQGRERRRSCTPPTSARSRATRSSSSSSPARTMHS